MVMGFPDAGMMAIMYSDRYLLNKTHRIGKKSASIRIGGRICSYLWGYPIPLCFLSTRM